MDGVLPSVEAFDAVFAHDIGEGAAEGGFLSLFWFELDGDFDHIDGLDKAGGDHSRESSDPEGLDGVEERRESSFFCRLWCHIN